MGDTEDLPEKPCELPSTAEEILVFTISSPHELSVADVRNRDKELSRISLKLSKLAKKYSRNLLNHPENGALTVVQGQVGTKAELPAWWCRGIVQRYTNSISEYKIYLPDHGITVSLHRHEFITIPEDSMTDEYLTYTIGLHNIIPGLLSCFAIEGKKKKYEMVIQKEWSPDAVKVTKCLIAGASKIYFDHIANDNGKKYGELYMIIDHDVVPLRKALVDCNFGAYLRKEDYDKIRELESRKPGDKDYKDKQVILEPPMSKPDDSINVISSKILLQDDNNNSNKINFSVDESEDKSYEEVFISDSSKCQRLTAISDANFSTSIHTALEEMEIEELWKIPSFIWPAISKYCDVLAVNAKGTGKTIGYAAPIANSILAAKQEQEDNYPMVLVLCSSTDAAQTAHDMFARILAHNADISIVSGYNGVHYRLLTAKIYNGCHIFISTPAFLSRYLSKEEYAKVLNLDYIRHVIFDQLDIILEKQKVELVKVLKETPIGKRKWVNLRGFTAQLIAVAERWSTTLGKFTEMFSDPYICIGSHPDAVISCGIQPKLRQIQSDQKPEQLLELLGDRYRAVKTLVVCRSRREASKLRKRLSGHCRILYADGKSSIDEIYGVKANWNIAISGLYPVLICTDSVLYDLKISDAEWLIHYSIATPTKTIFYFRFSTLISNLKNEQKTMEVTIMLDESNDMQLRGILNLMERSGVKLTEEQLDVADKIMMTLDRKKKEFLICNKVKSFGFCSSRFNCPYRHWVLSGIDKPRIPVEQGDSVKLVLTYLHTATHFSGRILERIDSNGQVHKMSDAEHVNIVTKVNHYFAVSTNRVMDKNISVGRIYGYRRDEGHYERVLIINIVKRDEDDRPKFVDLKCIDTGLGYNDIRVGALLELSEELREAPAYIIEIFLSNVMPYDNEDEWSLCARNCVHTWLKDHRSPVKFFQATVQLVLGNTLWVDPLEIKMKVVGRKDQQVSNLTSHLIKMNHGISDYDHMKRLQKLCRLATRHNPDPNTYS